MKILCGPCSWNHLVKVIQARKIKSMDNFFKFTEGKNLFILERFREEADPMMTQFDIGSFLTHVFGIKQFHICNLIKKNSSIEQIMTVRQFIRFLKDLSGIQQKMLAEDDSKGPLLTEMFCYSDMR